MVYTNRHTWQVKNIKFKLKITNIHTYMRYTYIHLLQNNDIHLTIKITCSYSFKLKCIHIVKLVLQYKVYWDNTMFKMYRLGTLIIFLHFNLFITKMQTAILTNLHKKLYYYISKYCVDNFSKIAILFAVI